MLGTMWIGKAVVLLSLLGLLMMCSCEYQSRPGSGPLVTQGSDGPDAIPAGGRMGDTLTTPGEFRRDGSWATPQHGEPTEPNSTGNTPIRIRPTEEQSNPKSVGG